MPPTNRCMTSLKVDCGRLNDSAIPTLLRGSLRELSLLNCSDFTGKLLSQIGHLCKDLRLGHIFQNTGFDPVCTVTSMLMKLNRDDFILEL